MAEHSESCLHLREVMDVHSDDVICQDCGLVLNSGVSLLEEGMSALELGESRVQRLELRVREDIMDVCARLYQDSSCILEDAVVEFKKLNPSLRLNRRAKDYMAYSIWRAMEKQGVPRSPQDVAAAAGACSLRVLRLIESLGRGGEHGARFRPSSYAEIACNLCGLPPYFAQLVKDVLLRKEGCYFGYRPETVTVSALLATLESFRDLKRRKEEELRAERSPVDFRPFPGVSLKSLCQAYGLRERQVTMLIRDWRPQFEVIERPIESGSRRYAIVFKE